MPIERRSDVVRTPNGNVRCKVCDYGSLEYRHLRGSMAARFGGVVLCTLGGFLCGVSALDTLSATTRLFADARNDLQQAVASLSLGVFAAYWQFWFVVGAASLCVSAPQTGTSHTFVQ